MMKWISRIVRLGLLAAALAALGYGWFIWVYPNSHPSSRTPGAAAVEVTIAPGTSVRALAVDLAEQGVLEHPRIWEWWMRHSGLDHSVVQGKVRIPLGLTPREVGEYVTRELGRVRLRVTLREGLTRFDIDRELAAAGVIDEPGAFVAATEDRALLDELGVQATTAEGWLFPDTYEFDDPTAINDVVRRLVQRSRDVMAKLLETHEQQAKKLRDELGWSDADFITMASIVEKEAALDHERERIAGVFINRLRSEKFAPTHLLQADPTVSYGCIAVPELAPSCESFTGRITRAMLDDPKNPYNTYQNGGLPPGPISNPGQRSIEATVNPEKHNYFYFVASGGGAHEFSTTFQNHDRAVTKYILNK